MNDAPADDDVRETYNFPPGAYGLVYRADIPDGGIPQDADPVQDSIHDESDPPHTESRRDYSYHLKAMKWGLVPFWTKRSPDYGSVMRTINCRDDSLIENRGMWTSMKHKKRCVVVCQGFYEWLKKGPGGKEKIPHFVKRKDSELMCFAGLWDCVKYEDSEEKLYTYTIITTDTNKQLNFLHDRMPVILDVASEAWNMWLDPHLNRWSKELQALLQPYKHELECYPVNKEVGKVGNNSPDFIVPIDSKDNKKNIANFFGNAQRKAERAAKEEPAEQRQTKDHESTEDNAPIPVSMSSPKGLKRSHSPVNASPEKAAKLDLPSLSSKKQPKSRSAISNEGVTKMRSPTKPTDGTQQITAFFGT